MSQTTRDKLNHSISIAQGGGATLINVTLPNEEIDEDPQVLATVFRSEGGWNVGVEVGETHTKFVFQ